MHDNVSVVQFSCELRDRSMAEVLKFALDQMVREHGLAGSGFTIAASEGDDADGTFDFDYQATVPCEMVYDTLMCFDYVRTHPEKAFDDEILLSSLILSYGEIVVIPNAEQSEESTIIEKDCQIDYLMDKNDLLSNAANDHQKAILLLSDRVESLSIAMQNNVKQISALKIYNFELQAFHKVQQLLVQVAQATGCQDILDEFEDFSLIH